MQHLYRSGTNLLSFTSPHFASGGIVVGSQNGDNATANVVSGTLATGGTSTLGSLAGSTARIREEGGTAEIVRTDRVLVRQALPTVRPGSGRIGRADGVE
jgi:hypothetical protein